jgi:epoxyqueuosine reductase
MALQAPLATDLTAHAMARHIKAQAHAVGFDLVGICSTEPSENRDYVRDWLASGQAGTMAYMADRFDERTDPQKYMPGAQSVICVALNYHVPLENVPADDRCQQGKIARYALGNDYHDVIKKRLHLLADAIRKMAPQAQTRCAVDTAPVLERELSARSGIGWIGKNTCVINPRIGSWILLGEVFTTLSLPTDEPIADHCGACTRCIDACPTQAITEPYQLDARRCISYLTIEHREPISPDVSAQMGDWLYGCDICQDVCPHNRHAPSAIDEDLRPRFPTGTLPAREVLNWDEEDYRQKLRKSAMKRVKLPMLKRNAEMVVQNNPERKALPQDIATASNAGCRAGFSPPAAPVGG